MKYFCYGFLAVLVAFLLSGQAYAHNEPEECAKTMSKLPDGAELVNLQEEYWNRHMLPSHDHCLVTWDTYKSGYVPSLRRENGCIYLSGTSIKYLPKGADTVYESGFFYKHFWLCPRLK